jgi:hypothetical protein
MLVRSAPGAVLRLSVGDLAVAGALVNCAEPKQHLEAGETGAAAVVAEAGLVIAVVDPSAELIELRRTPGAQVAKRGRARCSRCARSVLPTAMKRLAFPLISASSRSIGAPLRAGPGPLVPFLWRYSGLRR